MNNTELSKLRIESEKNFVFCVQFLLTSALLPSAFGCHLPRARGRLFVCGAWSVLRAGWGALPSPGGEGAELARRKGSMGSAGECGLSECAIRGLGWGVWLGASIDFSLFLWYALHR